MTELEQLQTESLGWVQIADDAYLHISDKQDVIQVVGIASPDMAECTVLWLTCQFT